MYLMKESEWFFHAKLTSFHYIKTRTRYVRLNDDDARFVLD